MNLYKNPEKDSKVPSSTILTPNPVELQRLWKSLFGEDYTPSYDEEEVYNSLEEDIGELDPEQNIAKEVVKVCKELSNTVILKKGTIDIISDGNRVFYCKVDGSMKRCGGQGDLLAGVLGTFSFYAKSATQKDEYPYESITKDENPLLLAAVAGSMINRMAAAEAFEKKGRSLVTPDIVDCYDISRYLSKL